MYKNPEPYTRIINWTFNTLNVDPDLWIAAYNVWMAIQEEFYIIDCPAKKKAGIIARTNEFLELADQAIARYEAK